MKMTDLQCGVGIGIVITLCSFTIAAILIELFVKKR